MTGLYYFDTEFIESGPHQPIDLISIGIVSPDGREFYAESGEYDPTHANGWVKANVFPHLVGTPMKLAEIAKGIRDFVTDANPNFIGYYASYDWVVLCQIFGTMMDLPRGWPMFCYDLKVEAEQLGNPRLPKEGSEDELGHNALVGARWTPSAYLCLHTH